MLNFFHIKVLDVLSQPLKCLKLVYFSTNFFLIMYVQNSQKSGLWPTDTNKHLSNNESALEFSGVYVAILFTNFVSNTLSDLPT